VAALAAIAVVSHLSAATLLPMDLDDLCHRADRIFRGTILHIKSGTVTAGGGEIPTVHYTVEVVEPFKGDFTTTGDRKLVEIVMLGKGKPVRVGDFELRSPLPDMPQLRIGENYLLFTTAPGPAGLSTTVGLGQGSFHLTGKPGLETAVNGFENRHLISGMTPTGSPAGEPLPYADLAERIRFELEITPGADR
jgi:hypothetical protein